MYPIACVVDTDLSVGKDAPMEEARAFTRRIGERVCQARKGRGWSQEELAKRAELNKETVNRLELGGNAKVDTVVRIAAVLGQSAEGLFAGRDLTRHEASASSDASEASARHVPAADPAHLLERLEARHDSVLNAIEKFAQDLDAFVANERKALEASGQESTRRRHRRTAHR